MEGGPPDGREPPVYGSLNRRDGSDGAGGEPHTPLSLERADERRSRRWPSVMALISGTAVAVLGFAARGRGGVSAVDAALHVNAAVGEQLNAQPGDMMTKPHIVLMVGDDMGLEGRNQTFVH